MALSKGVSLKSGKTGLTNIKAGSKYSIVPAPKAAPKSNAPSIPVGGYNPAQVGYQGASHPDMNFDGGLDTYGVGDDSSTAEAGQSTTV